MAYTAPGAGNFPSTILREYTGIEHAPSRFNLIPTTAASHYNRHQFASSNNISKQTDSCSIIQHDRHRHGRLRQQSRNRNNPPSDRRQHTTSPRERTTHIQCTTRRRFPTKGYGDPPPSLGRQDGESSSARSLPVAARRGLYLFH